MNVEVIGRIRPNQKTERGEDLIIDGQRLAAHSRGPYINFKALHRQDASNLDLFRTCVDDLLDYYLAGFNCCLIVMGESGSGKTHTLAGEGTSKAGLVPTILDAVFARLHADRYMADTRVKRQNPTITFKMHEIYNELIKDLLHVPGSQSHYLELGEHAEKGTFVKNCTSIHVRDAGEAIQQFRQGLSRCTEQSTDYGPAHRNSALVCHLDLSVVVGDNPKPVKCRFTIVKFPSLEKLSDDPNQLRQREGPALSKALLSLNQVVTSLASYPYADRVINYSDSKLTLLLKNELGGNCKTRAILCLKPVFDQDVLSAILNFSTRLSHVKNFPIVNDSLAQDLITQFRANIIDLKQQAGFGPVSQGARMTNAGDPKEAAKQLEVENLVLKERCERLQTRMDNMQNKYGNLATTKTDLSSELLESQEHKLRLGQQLVELQIEMNKKMEEYEANTFELTNKILILENENLEAQNERDRNARNARHAKERLLDMEKERKDLAEEFVIVKTNLLALQRENDKEVERNEQLSLELLNLVNSKAALMRQVAVLSNGDNYRSGEPEAEIDRVKGVVINNSAGRVKPNEILGTQQDRDSVEQTLFANKKKHENELERLRREHGEEASKKSKQLGELQKDFQDTRNLARERQQQISELNAALILARSEKESLEMQRNRLQHKCKDLGEDFRARLIKYVEDISDHVEKGSGVPDGKRDKRMKEYVDSMIKDLARSHKEREDQLSQACQGYREAKRFYMRKYEELLIHYRKLRMVAESRGIESTDLGPDEHQMNLDEAELKNSHLREISRLKAELTSKTADLDSLKMKYDLSDDLQDRSVYKAGEKPPQSWAELRKQMREFTKNTQQQLEEERAQLHSENQVLKEQLKESENYIDTHLARYKQEIVRLRKQLGQEEDSAMVFSDRSRGKGRYRRH